MSNDTGSSGEPKVSPLPKACENCRIRKIRCNRTSPCSNCSSSGIECRPSSKQIEHRPRMIVSNHYEKQIDRIHERLVGIEGALKTTSRSPPQTTPSPQSHTSQPASTVTPTSTLSQYEGDSSFQSQSLRASEVVRSLSIKHDEEISHAIDSLKDIGSISMASTHHVHFTAVEDRAPGPQMEMLPAEVVIKVLNRVKQKLPVCFLQLAAPNDGHLEKLCQRAYFPTDRMSLGEMTTMYGLLWSVIQEYIWFNDPVISEFEAQKYADICERNLHAGVETYELLADPTYDNVFAVMLAATKAQDEGKMILCWTLVSTAARHVQALGYHREATHRNDNPATADKKRHLFWSVYSLERNMSLNLGRAPSLHDWDIDVKMFRGSDDPSIRPWATGTVIFTHMARVQGQMYEQLYSISAASKSNAERARVIDKLSASMDQQYKNIRSLDWTKAAYPEFFHMFFEACDIIYYSILTLLYRGSCNPQEGAEISAKCFEAARQCLNCHLQYFPNFLNKGEVMVTGYINWILLYCSFTPFIVIFLHAIASMSPDDVKLLKDMTASLEPAKTLSPVLHRLYSTCHVFAHVAESIVRAAGEENHPGLGGGLGTYDHQTDSLLFPGFATGGGPGGSGGGPGTFDPQMLPEIFMPGNPMTATGSNFDDMSAYFGNWVGSGQPVMDLFNMDVGQHI